MPLNAACPQCAHQFPVTESRQACTVACPACDAPMTVEFQKPTQVPEAGQPHYDLLVKPGALAATPPTERKKKRTADEDDLPPRKGGSMAVVFLSAGFGMMLVLGGLGLTAWVLFGLIDTTPTAFASNNRTNSSVNQPKIVPLNPSPSLSQNPSPNPNPIRPIEPITRPKVGMNQLPIGGVNPKPAPPAGVELPAAPNPTDIKSAPVTESTSYKLPEPVRSLRVGGGGRFLILHFPKTRKIGIFDANEAKIVRYIAAPEEDAHFAAGMDKLVMYLPGSKLIARFNLLTGVRELATRLELPAGKVDSFCMGHASAGPLLVSVAGSARLYDIAKFKEIELPAQEGGGETRLEGGLYWAGATGRVFGHTGNYGLPNGVKTVVIGEKGVQQYGEHKSTWFVVPGPDDKYVYAAGHGIVSERVRPVPNVPFSMGENSGFASQLYLPAHHGPFYLHAMTIEDYNDKTPVGTVRVYMHGSKEPIATYEKTAVCKYGWEGLRGLGIEHSMHLIPKAKLLVIVPEGRDELRLYPADLDAALDKAGRDYVVITSTPPAKFEKGREFTYQIEAKVRKGPAAFRLESGPAGMTVDRTGLVRWTVPANFAEDRADVILVVKDAGDQEAFHTFTLTK